jgi:exonuclease SbcD
VRLIHTSDWHLGRTLHGAALIEDQAYLLEQFVDLVRQEKPDAVLIAGDVYDRAVPPTEAIDLLDEMLSRLVLNLKLRVVLIAGNHDSAPRLSFGSRLLAGRGLHILGSPVATSSSLVLEDKCGPLHIYPLPYAEPATVRHFTEREDVQGHQAAMKVLLEGVWSRHPKGARSVAMAHCFVTGSTGCESERPIGIGGAGSIEADVFNGFNYVALGHLHRPQPCAGGKLWYSGSLMRYSFSEVDHDKAVLLIDVDGEGQCIVNKVQLTPRRQVRRIEGCIDQIIADAAKDKAPDDYLMVTLLDQGPVFDAMGKLRVVYPNVLHIERPAVTSPSGGGRVDHRKMDEMQLFGAFVKEVTGGALTEAQSAAFAKVADQVRRAQREEVA